MNKTTTEPLFYEIQRFSRVWLWALHLPLSLCLIGTFGWALVQQLVLRRPWGDRPLSDPGLALTGGLMIIWGLASPVLFTRMQLEVAVTAGELRCSFWPFVRRTISLQGIRSCAARSYHPLREYGGWGIRWGRGGKAYNVSGNRGVQLELVSGERLLIGSQRPDELATAIQSGMKQGAG